MNVKFQKNGFIFYENGFLADNFRYEVRLIRNFKEIIILDRDELAFINHRLEIKLFQGFNRNFCGKSPA